MIRDEIYCYIMTNIEFYDKREFTQKEVSTKLGVSIGTVNYVVKQLENIGIVLKNQRGFTVIDPRKLLQVWAVQHKLRIRYKTYYPLKPVQIETLMPQGLFTTFSGSKLYYDIYPSDYMEVFIYTDCNELKNRFPPREGIPNIYCLEPLKCFKILGLKKTPLSLIYVDIFNTPYWYSLEFRNTIEGVLNEILE